jgi:anti-sigma B factor antagonist
MESFELIERERQPGCWEIQVEGDLDLSVAERFQEALDRAGPDQSRVLISLENCPFIDSTGIAVIVRAHTEMAKQGRQIAVYGASDQVLRILSITGLTENGLVFKDADEALAASDSSAAPAA